MFKKSFLCLMFMSLASMAYHQNRIDITVGNYVGSDVLYDFPVAIRLSENISGFSYSDCHAQGYDIAFKDLNGNVLNYEIDTWNSAGESLIWVKVPELMKDTVITMYYNDSEKASAVAPSADFTKAVWSKYTAVFHLGNFTQDSTGHGLSVSLVDNATNVDSTIAGQGVRLNVVEGLDCVVLGSCQHLASDINKQTISMWFNKNPEFEFQRRKETTIFGNKKTQTYENGIYWGIYDMRFQARGADHNTTINTGIFNNRFFIADTWTHISTRYKDSQLAIFANGAFENSGAIQPIGAKNGDFYIGRFPTTTTTNQCYRGMIDEVRFYDGAASDDWVKAEYDTLASADFVSFGDVISSGTESLPEFGETSYSYNNQDNVLTVTSTLVAGAVDKLYLDINGARHELSTEQISASQGFVPLSYNVDVASYVDTMVNVKLVAAIATSETTESTFAVYSDNWYIGNIEVAKVNDADELSDTAGVFTFTRADASLPLYINYAVAGTAIPGQTYETLSGVVLMGVGENTVSIPVKPILDWATQEDTTVEITIAAGKYGFVEDANSTIVNIIDVVFDPEYNIWISTSNNDAKVASNWSYGRAPIATDKILVDGGYSNVKMEWDAADGVLPNTVASWTQRSDYTNEVTIATTYPHFSEAFTTFTITGDLTLDGGFIAQKSHGTTVFSLTQDNSKYMLNLVVNGNANIGANGTVSAKGKGFYTAYWSYRGLAPHGGEVFYTGTYSESSDYRVYGDIFLPNANAYAACNGTDGGRTTNGGGAISFVVNGVLNNMGCISADGGFQYEASGSGGSVYVNANTVVGTGKVSANAKPATKSDGAYTAGSGGRVAVIVRNGEGFPSTSLTAFGTLDNQYRAGKSLGAAGTVYQQTQSERALIVRGHVTTITLPTPIPAISDTNNWKDQSDLAIDGAEYSHIKFTRDVCAKSLSVKADKDATVDLAGNRIVVAEAYVNGEKLQSGEYTLETATLNGWTWLLDSSDDAETTEVYESTGSLVVGNSATVIIIK